MSIDKAREALNVASAYLTKPWADTTRFGSALPCIVQAIDHIIKSLDARLSPAPVGGETDVRAVVRDELAKAEAERRQRLDDFKSGIGSPLFVNLGTSEEDMARLNCPACGGSGHIDDAAPTPPPAEPDGGFWREYDAEVIRGMTETIALLQATIAERDRRIAALEAGLPNLSAVISWLENGCSPAYAAGELRTYQERIRALHAPTETQP